MTKSFRYRVYGAIAASFGGSPSLSGYAGEVSDVNGLIYLRARWYDPISLVFISRDPFMGESSKPTSLNAFIYATRRPTMLVDPSGLDPASHGNWAYAIADVFRDLDSPDPATRRGAYLKVVGIGIGAGAVGAVGWHLAAAALASPAGTVVTTRLVTAGTAALPIVFKAEHVIENYGGDEEAMITAEGTILQDIVSLQSSTSLGSSWWGWVNTGSTWIQYRAQEARDATGELILNVGTHFPVSGPLKLH